MLNMLLSIEKKLHSKQKKVKLNCIFSLMNRLLKFILPMELLYLLLRFFQVNQKRDWSFIVTAQQFSSKIFITGK